jgi:hypothetical protein
MCQLCFIIKLKMPTLLAMTMALPGIGHTEPGKWGSQMVFLTQGCGLAASPLRINPLPLWSSLYLDNMRANVPIWKVWNSILHKKTPKQKPPKCPSPKNEHINHGSAHNVTLQGKDNE